MEDLMKMASKVNIDGKTEPPVRVNQVWVERAVTFANAYATIFTVEDIDREFKESEFDDLQQFKKYNQLYLIDNTYVKVASEVMLLKSDIVRQCYEKLLGKFTNFEKFLQSEDIFEVKDKFYRVTPSFSKIKFLEVVSHIPWRELVIPDSNFLDFLSLSELLQSEDAALKFSILGKSVGFWEVIDPINNVDQETKRSVSHLSLNSFNVIQLGILIDPVLIDCLMEFMGGSPYPS